MKIPLALAILLGCAVVANGQTINGHEYVDLGLSVKWATCNVGANSPEEYGNYYAWGETTTKNSYDGDNSKTSGKRMGDVFGDPANDAARANWGGPWRLPIKAEFEELMSNCTWTWTTQGGRNGYKVTSQMKGYEGASIFLPAAGSLVGKTLYDDGRDGRYWSSTPDSYTLSAFHLYFDRTYHLTNWNYRLCGLSVRPVSE